MIVPRLFAMLVLFQLKHFVADYPLQSPTFFIGKFRPGWNFVGPLLAHVGIHALGTAAIALWWGALPHQAVGLALFDAAVHFVMDRAKASPRWLGRWKPLSGVDYMASVNALNGHRVHIEYPEYQKDHARKALRGNTLFWCSLGFDQMVHHLTHYAVCWALVVGV